jgi:hypothetical protein
MNFVDEFHLWLDANNAWGFQQILVLWAIVCCGYASAKFGGMIANKITTFISEFINFRKSEMVGWLVGQLCLIASLGACFFAAMAFSYTEESIKNIQARKVLVGILSYSEWNDQIREAAKWIKDNSLLEWE